jgi:hypothetical protein
VRAPSAAEDEAVAFGRIDTDNGPPELGPPDSWWIDPSDRARQRYFVPLEFYVDLTKRPIAGADLKEDPRYVDSSVITFPRGANPHELDNRQWRAITSRVFR